MGANKFATMLHRNKTPRIAIILIYTLLEWVLIALLLWNGLLSHLIARFADFFGLKPPCVFCSRIDRRKSHRELVCDGHAAEVSKLGYCSSHRNLADAGEMCEDCHSSRPDAADRAVAVLSWMKRSEAGEKDLRCSCCDVILESGFYSPHLAIEPSSCVALGSDPKGDESSELIAPMRAGNEVLGMEERWVPVELIDSWTLIENKLNSVADEDAAVDIGIVSTVEISNSKNPPLVDHQCGCPHLVSALEEELEVHMGAEYADGFGEFQAFEDDGGVMDAEANCEISIGSEICDHEQIKLPHFEECADEHCAASSDATIDKEQVTEARTLEESIETSVNGLSICTEVYGGEDDRMPETPTSVDGLLALHKRFLLLEMRESGSESLDGSVASEIDGNEILTVDHLKAALRAERKALSALYTELDEERSASAIAASQTMAMITRLQEEKAAVQMEALQYQRMMEEQSEYDQEVLQLLNELMMKREKEKQELEIELEVCRKRVLIYEAKERSKAAERSTTNGTSSASSSAEDSDDISFESHEGENCKYGHKESSQHTRTDDVLSSGADRDATNHLMVISLDESLADFEEERFSILEQVKALEEKLFSMDDDELKYNGHQHFSDENGHVLNGDYDSYGDNMNGNLDNGFGHDFCTSGKFHQKQKNKLSGGRRLLPLFDATVGMESDDMMRPEHERRNSSPRSVSKCATDDHKRLAVAEEVDNVYEILQALEADIEFLKHCIRSLKQGDKGMDLLQEILQHLRGLRNVELRVRNAGDVHTSLPT